MADRHEGHLEAVLQKQSSTQIRSWQQSESYELEGFEKQLAVWHVRKVVYIILGSLFFTAMAIKAHEKFERALGCK